MDKGLKTLLLFCIPLLLLFVVTLYIYASFVTGDEVYFLHPSKYISTSSTKWAEFGTLLSGLFTLLGSLATIMTMAFLLKQNKDNLERVDKQLAQAEETYKAGVDFNNFQQEQMMFDKFKLHREMFKEMLEQFESDENNEIVISSKMDLYSDVFRFNSFANCETGVSLSSKVNSDDIISKLCTIVDKRNSILSKVESNSYQSNPFSLLNDVYDFNSHIGLGWKRDYLSGDVTLYGQTIVLNILNVQRSLLLIDNITLKLVSFSHAGTLIQESKKFSSSKLTLSLMGYLRQLHKHKRRFPAFPYDWHPINTRIASSFALYKKIINLDKKAQLIESLKYAEHYLGFYPNLINLDDKDYFVSFMQTLSSRMLHDSKTSINLRTMPQLREEFDRIFHSVMYNSTP